eukprot:TRINITY_DN14270_c0_g1_i1.p1 TRINITY_DN14270_c0_g1~~TRINITY_DN14270_c0_g1_i1.p1  ORF type:complete len:410 (-),score=41.51 TRINITY_DN14270_c0_g1_i1:35-1264(-)
MFFWFTEAEDKPEDAPLVVWLQGGPGCSSLFGFALENGPYHPDVSSARAEGMIPFSYGWNRFANTLYIESPAGVGFSYSNTPSDYNTGDNQTATDNYHFLQDWLNVFTDYKKHDLWLTGESYAGVYVPTLAYKIVTGANIPLKDQLKGIMLGNPVLDCPQFGINVNNAATQVSLFYWHASIPYRTYKAWLEAGCGEITPPDKAKCNSMFSDIFKQVGDFDPDDLFYNFCTGNGTLDVMESLPGCTTPEMHITTWYNRKDLKAAIHAKADITWTGCTNKINYVTTNPDILNYLTVIFKEKPQLHVLYYSGDVDIATVPFAFTQECLFQLNRPVTKPWTSWYLPGTTSLAGYYEATDKYTYATVKGAGHEVPLYQPASMFYVFSNFLQSQSIPQNKPTTPQSHGLYPKIPK